MTEQPFDGFTRHATTVISRRGSLLTLGGAGLAALAGPATARAGKNVKKRARKKGKKKCKRQVEQCRTYWDDYCQATGGCDPQVLEEVLACCDLLGQCQNAAFFGCFLGAETRR